MKVDRTKLKSNIEKVIGDGVVNGEEIDITTKKIMDEIEILIRVVEQKQVKGDSKW